MQEKTETEKPVSGDNHSRNDAINASRRASPSAKGEAVWNQQPSARLAGRTREYAERDLHQEAGENGRKFIFSCHVETVDAHHGDGIADIESIVDKRRDSVTLCHDPDRASVSAARLRLSG